MYFVTICCENRICRFGNINNGEIENTQWLKLAERFSNYELDVFQIMPNHIHGIIVLNNPTTPTVGAPLAGAPIANAPIAVAPNDDVAGNYENCARADSIIGAGTSPARTGANAADLGDIVGAYKSILANECLKIYKLNNQIMGKLWQRNYYEIIIRNQKSYMSISEYIINNPS
ncbi:MAG TPA: transposase, partial [Aequorivita sp.]|nr:transposase [Aequorivita sp.]